MLHQVTIGSVNLLNTGVVYKYTIVFKMQHLDLNSITVNAQNIAQIDT